jgi:hypothetical protein
LLADFYFDHANEHIDLGKLHLANFFQIVLDLCDFLLELLDRESSLAQALMITVFEDLVPIFVLKLLHG